MSGPSNLDGERLAPVVEIGLHNQTSTEVTPRQLGRMFNELIERGEIEPTGALILYWTDDEEGVSFSRMAANVTNVQELAILDVYKRDALESWLG